MLKNTFTAIIIILLVGFSLFTAYTESDNPLIVTDDKTGKSYTIISNGKIRKITYGDNSTGEVYIPEFDSVSVFEEVFTFYDTDDLNRKLNIYIYSPNTDEILAFVIAENACFNPLCFKTDVDGNIYFVSADDSKVLCVYSDGEVTEVKTDAIIKQILCDNNGKIIVATSNNTLMYLENGFEVISHTPPETPLSFSGGQLIDCNNSPVISEESAESTISAASSETEVVCTEPILSGDINKDGKINKSDTMKILNHLSGKEILSQDTESTADINADGTVDLKDVQMILRMY